MDGDARARLASLIQARRRELRISEREAAARGSLARNTWASAEAGTRHIAERTASGIEVALEWAPGSVEAILAGGEPTILERRPAGLLVPDSLPSGSYPHGMTIRGGRDFDLAAEVRRIRHLQLPADSRLELIRSVIDLYQEVATESGSESEPVEGGSPPSS